MSWNRSFCNLERAQEVSEACLLRGDGSMLLSEMVLLNRYQTSNLVVILHTPSGLDRCFADLNIPFKIQNVARSFHEA